MADCKGCGGSGKCSKCSGSGREGLIKGCSKCGGSGNCTVCKGSGRQTGLLPQFLQVRLCGLLVSGAILGSGNSLLAAPGDLDTSFGNGGKVLVTSPIGEGTAMTLQSDGKAIVVGSSTTGFFIARHNIDGAVDTSFGTMGRTIVTFSSSARPTAVALQPDGKIVVIGLTNSGPNSTIVIARLTTSGNIDDTFDGDGKVTTLVGASCDASSLVVLSDGKIVVGGSTRSSSSASTTNFLMLRYNSNGSLDTSFDLDGFAITPVGAGFDAVLAIAQQADGKYVSAGEVDTAFDQWGVVRYNNNGSLDATGFGAGGKVIGQFGTGDGLANTIALQSDQKILIAGGSSAGFSTARLLTNGAFDTSFDGDGIVYTNTLNLAQASKVRLQSNGKIIVAGSAADDPGFALVRYTTSGVLDSGFGTGGIVRTDISDQEFLHSCEIRKDGRILTAGTITNGYALAQYLGDTNMPAVLSPFDFDGDGRTDVSVWRPADGNWHLSRSTDGYAAYTWGANGDKIVPHDFDGDGKADVAVWRPADGTWHILNSNGGTYSTYTWGASGDLPVVGDYDDDGKADVAVYRPADGNWHIRRSSDGGYTNVIWGVAGDVPVAGDFDGDGQSDIAVRRLSTGEWFIDRSTAGYISVTWGVGTDTAVHADYDGDQKDDIAVWRPSTGEWFILRSTDGGFTQSTWGSTGDVPVPGDYDGDGRSDISVVRNGTWHISQSTDGYRTTTWGVGSDIAIPGR